MIDEPSPDEDRRTPAQSDSAPPKRRDERTDADPTVVRSIAVTVGDVVAAFEATTRGRRRTVLRITPPFAGRMRARLHVEGGEGAYERAAAPIHVDPRDLIRDEAPPYPEVDETAREFDDGSYDVDEHHARHLAAVESWREAVRDCLVDRVELQTPSGPHEVKVRTLR